MSDLIQSHLETDDAELEARWERLQAWLRDRFGRDTGIEAILFLVGIQTRGRGFEPKLHRDRKQDVIMEGTYAVFERLGIYERVGMESDGAWIYERTIPSIPKMELEEQEKLLKLGILAYFEPILES